MIEEGVYPRLVITHGGMGLGLFVKDILPNTSILGYSNGTLRKKRPNG